MPAVQLVLSDTIFSPSAACETVAPLVRFQRSTAYPVAPCAPFTPACAIGWTKSLLSSRLYTHAPVSPFAPVAPVSALAAPCGPCAPCRPLRSLWPLHALWPLLALRPLRSLCLYARIQFADKPVAVLADVRRRAGRPRQFRFLFRGQVVKGQAERLLRAFDVNAHWRALYAARAASLVSLHFIPP